VVPQRRGLLAWFHRVEDDRIRASHAFLNGANLIQTAIQDDLIEAQDTDGFAHLIIEMHSDGLIGFTAFDSGPRRFGSNPSYDIQQAIDFRSTPAGRHWLAASGPTISVTNSQIGQLAGGDITNINIVQLLEAALIQIDELDAPEEERDAARSLLQRMLDGTSGMAASTGAGVAAQAIAKVLGIG
jgi:hypothetical protein